MKPILFNTPMVKAILDGRKTQTRRVIKNEMMIIVDSIYKYSIRDKRLLWNEFKTLSEFIDFASPYKIGDILYVRETFLLREIESSFDYPHENEYCIIERDGGNPIYRADHFEDANNNMFSDDKYDRPKWKPSIHMQKKYARIFLKVTNVRVERLQDISGVCIEEEGAPYQTSKEKLVLLKKERLENIKWWIKLWNSTTPQGYKWEDNCYVFVYEFEKVEQ